MCDWLSENERVVQIDVGSVLCVLKDDGTAECSGTRSWCWGNSSGECWMVPPQDITFSQTGETFSPPGDILFTAVSVGDAMCGIRADNGQEACWYGMIRNIWQ